MCAILIFSNDCWYLNIWENAAFGALLIDSRKFNTSIEALDWLWKESGYDIRNLSIRK